MTKDEIGQELAELYARNEPLDEETLSERSEGFHAAVLEAYGTWEKAMKRNGFTRRKLRERDKFVLYWVMKRRYERNGEEALRPKNIDQGTKEKINDLFKSIKVVQDLVKSWSRDRILYELRAIMLSGGFFEEIEIDHAELHQQIMSQFGGMAEARREYGERFGAGRFGEGKNEKEEREKGAAPDVSEIINAIVQLGFLDGRQAQAVLESRRVTKEEMHAFLLDEATAAWKTKRPISQERVESANPAMYYAIKSEYGGIQEAFEELMKTAFVVAK